MFFYLSLLYCQCGPCLIYAALRGAATLKARALKEMWNISAVTPLEKSKGIGICGGKANNNSSSSTSDSGGEVINADNFLSACSQELLARGTELLKRTRKGNFNKSSFETLIFVFICAKILNSIW
jgi:hypothetical protein